MKFGIVVFPGSNCDRDCVTALNSLGFVAEMLWYADRHDLSSYGCIILPGGFSYGDYLRAGAMAAVTPIMDSVEEFAARGGLVLGICNGFQVLLERGLLPGAMVPNKGMNFICKYVNLRVENVNTPFTADYRPGEVISMPIAHQEGNYYYPGSWHEIEGQVVFRYTTPEGKVTVDSNPNGSWQNVAGITNKERNILGMMPHPERAVEAILGAGETDGARIFTSIVKSVLREVGYSGQ